MTGKSWLQLQIRRRHNTESQTKAMTTMVSHEDTDFVYEFNLKHSVTFLCKNSVFLKFPKMLSASHYLLKTHPYILFLVIFFPPLAHSLSFNITHFDSAGTSKIAFEGDAKTAFESIGLNVDDMFRVGRATYAEPFQLWLSDSYSKHVADFTTSFSFIIDTHNHSVFSDGFAFYMASQGYSIPPNSAGGDLGLFNMTTYGGVPQNHIVAVEFDTFSNNEFDPSSPHVGINNNSIKSLVHSTSFDVANNSGKPARALITYKATTMNLSVFWSFNGSQPFTLDSSLSCIIDLTEVLPQLVTIGFSAATGLYPEQHIIQSWEFHSNLDTTRTTGGRWTKTTVTIVIACCTFIWVIVIAVIGGLIIKWKSKDDKVETSKHFDLDKVTFPRRFCYQELFAATNGFANDRKLGRGASGQVYKGVLSDLGRIIAVKRISADFGSSERIFTNEVKIISRLIHRNLVQFIGWCHNKPGEFLLVYEYMPNGSLDTHLFGNRKTLPWNVRYKIALGMATALHYLHEEAEQCVLHRDIKSANVLLDTDFTTKLGDFGVAKLVDPRLRSQIRTGVVGTYGYLAPEYINGGKASKESDMYSFGVVALELACGRRSYQDGEEHVPLVNWVRQLYVERNILDAADERLNTDFDVNEMTCLLIVGLWCTQLNDQERPRADQVIRVLKLEASMPVLPFA